MAERIRVRMVPKNKSGQSFTLELPQVTAKVAKNYLPDEGRAQSAHATAFSMGIDAHISPRNTIEGFVESEKFEDTFGTKLITDQIELDERSDYASGTKKYRRPEGALSVPEDLRETIAFAYVPTPPQFYALSFVPPNVSLYHLRLSDVLRAFKGGLCHRRGWTGRGTRVAMADSGFSRHPYFEQQGYNIQRVSTPSTTHPAVDTSGHGTGESANALVLAPDCRFFGIKHDDYSAEALETSLAQNPHILVNSWGWDIDNQSMQDLQNDDPNLYHEIRDIEQIIADAIDDGVTIIFAGGNGQLAFPACMPEVIAVGGTTVEANGSLKASSYASSFASQLYPGRRVPDFCGIVGESGPKPQKGHIMLPVPNGSKREGKNLPASQSKKGWGIFSGTSAAAPQVAGVVSLMLSVNPTLTPAEIKTILADTATDVTKGQSIHRASAAVGYDHATGAGFVNAFEACLRADQMLQEDA